MKIPKRPILPFVYFALSLLNCGLAWGRDMAGLAQDLHTPEKTQGADPGLSAFDEQVVGRWRDMRLGLFIHWGPVSQRPEWEISWSRKDPRFFEVKPGEKSNVEEYDSLWKTFNPVKFDAAKWVSMVKDNGFSYIVFICKHHDGFSMFDTALSEYKITRTPFGRDPLAELASECHKQGIGLGVYYSPMDWWNPIQTDDQRSLEEKKIAGVKPPMYTPATEEYREFLHGQVRELCTRYGEVMEMWFDGGSTKREDNGADALVAMVRELQPKAMINHRSYASGGGFFETPEGRNGKFNITRPWELCQTLGEGGWSYRNDKPKSFPYLLQNLLWSATGDGNFLLNMGPMADGTFDPRHVARFEEIGAWLKLYGNTVKGTRGGPFPMASYGGSAWRGDHIFLHVMFPENGPIRLPAIGRKIISATCLTPGKVSLRQPAGPGSGAVLTLEEKVPADQYDTIIDLQLDGPVEGIKVAQIPPAVTLGKPCSASSNPEAASQACDGSGKGWAPDKADSEPWLEVDAGKPVTVSEAYLSVQMHHKQSLGDFEIQARIGDDWTMIGKGTSVYERTWIVMPPVTAQVFRLHFFRPVDREILEFQLFQTP